jgi:hypothetical protein
MGMRNMNRSCYACATLSRDTNMNMNRELPYIFCPLVSFCSSLLDERTATFCSSLLDERTATLRWLSRDTNGSRRAHTKKSQRDKKSRTPYIFCPYISVCRSLLDERSATLRWLSRDMNGPCQHKKVATTKKIVNSIHFFVPMSVFVALYWMSGVPP